MSRRETPQVKLMRKAYEQRFWRNHRRAQFERKKELEAELTAINNITFDPSSLPDEGDIYAPSLMPIRPAKYVIRMNAAVLFAHDMLRRVADPQIRLSSANLYRHCETYCAERALAVPSRSALAQTLAALGIDRIKTGGRIYYCGVVLRSDPRASARLTVPEANVADRAMRLDTRKALSITEFCAAYGISRSTFYRLQRKGEAPAVMQVGRVRRIRVEEAEAWAQRMQLQQGLAAG